MNAIPSLRFQTTRSLSGLALAVAVWMTAPWPASAIPSEGLPTVDVVSSDGTVLEAIVPTCDDDIVNQGCQCVDCCVYVDYLGADLCKAPDPCVVDANCPVNSQGAVGRCAAFVGAEAFEATTICVYPDPPIDTVPIDFCATGSTRLTVDQQTAHKCTLYQGASQSRYELGDCDSDGIRNGEDCLPCVYDPGATRRRSTTGCEQDSVAGGSEAGGTEAAGGKSAASSSSAAPRDLQGNSISFAGGGGCSATGGMAAGRGAPLGSAVLLMMAAVGVAWRRRRCYAAPRHEPRVRSR